MGKPGGAWQVETTSCYRRVRALASGGMGVVDLAVRREGSFVRLCAVKRLHAHLRDDPDVRSMFVDEARIAGLIRHPHVVSVIDVGEDADGPFLVMEYVDGVTLGALVRRVASRQEKVPLAVALRIVLDAAQGLRAAHALKGPAGEPLELVHRDVSPHNILVSFDGTARVTDFGIARALGRQSKTSTGILKGKLGYMAPEQLRFRCDRRTDLFALGVVLFELLAARRLYASKEAEETARRILDEPPPDLADERDDAPPELVGLVFRLLAKDPAHRPDDASAVVRVLEEILAELTSSGQGADVGEYVRELFAEERVEQERELARALEAPDEASEVEGAASVAAEEAAVLPIAVRAETTSPASSKRRAPWLAAAAVVALVLTALVGGALALGDPSGDDERAVPESAAAPATALEAATASSADERRIERAAEAEADRAAPSTEAEIEAEAEIEVEVEAEAEVEPARPSRDRARRGRSRRRGGSEDGVRIWDWQQ